MNKCWNSEPSERPTLKILEDTISEWLGHINTYYNFVNTFVGNSVDWTGIFESGNIMKEFAKADKALVQNQADSSIMQSYIKSCLLDFTEKLNDTLKDQLLLHR